MVDWYRSELELIGGIRCIASGDCHHVLNLIGWSYNCVDPLGWYASLVSSFSLPI